MTWMKQFYPRLLGQNRLKQGHFSGSAVFRLFQDILTGFKHSSTSRRCGDLRIGKRRAFLPVANTVLLEDTNTKQHEVHIQV